MITQDETGTHPASSRSGYPVRVNRARRAFVRTNGGREVLSVVQMRQADAHAIAAGTAGIVLMDRAGATIARAVRRRWTPRPVLVLCGPGNNGGDGFAAAVRLAAEGWPVTLALAGAREGLRGDAALMAARWEGAIESLDPALAARHALVIDALFGAGLSRPVSSAAAETLDAVAATGMPVAAVDVPSGVSGDTGKVLGTAAPAALTVTFCRPKPGHMLLPGRALCGEIDVADIGIGADSVAAAGHTARVNGPALWRGRLPLAASDGHKYRRGHAVIVGGEQTTGAARLAARASLCAGAGLVTVAAPAPALPVYEASLTAVMTQPLAAWPALLADPRKNAFLVGPGNGVTGETRERSLAALAAGKAVVLDADALSVFSDARDDLYLATRGRRCILTPHDGEYARLFGFSGDRLTRARAAAEACGAVVLLKGPETVIAAPDGRAVIGLDGPPELATAGTGDVLAGIVTGLLAAGAPPFEAACTAAWLHGAAAPPGPGLIAEDLADRLPAALAEAAQHPTSFLVPET